MPRHDDTIAALATPAGTAALALVRITGPDTYRIADGIAGGPPPPRHPRHVDYRRRDGAVLDDVVLTLYRGPRSYTGEDAMEVTCHGNPFIAQAILEDLYARGCRPAGPGEFTQRAFLNGRMDLSQAEAVMDVIHARGERALAAANRQLRGALGRRMGALVDRLLAVLARIEAHIDFPDEDLPAEDRGRVMDELRRLEAETGRLLATRRFGELLREGIRTVIVGAPNVGKSSLLNRLVGSDRALVSPEPGTTRDFIEERMMAGPHCLRIIDTAGLNPDPAPIERLGIEKALERAAEADLFLVVSDASEGTDAGPPPSLRGALAPENTLVVLNKIDLAPHPAAPPWSRGFGVAPVSALSGEGIDMLVRAIVRLADAFQTDVGEDAVAIAARHANALVEALSGLAAARDQLQHESRMELVASNLQSTLAAYGEIVGRVDNERMLDELFAAFCIGK